MTYEIENVAATLRAARKRSGLSQRALGTIAGVPQSHISKIERGHVNLTVSSLAAIANSLGLDVVLVPRKAIPAVKAISRSAGIGRQDLSGIRKELARIARRLDRVEVPTIDLPVHEDLQRRFRELQQFAHLVGNESALADINTTLAAYERTGDSAALLREAAQQIDEIRTALAHGGQADHRTGTTRPAYRLDEGSDD